MPQSFATSKHSCSDFDNLEMDVGTNVLMIMHVNDISRLSFGISNNHECYSKHGKTKTETTGWLPCLLRGPGNHGDLARLPVMAYADV